MPNSFIGAMSDSQAFHESLRAQTMVKQGSDRSFGLIVGAALAIIGGIRVAGSGLSAPEIGLFAAALLLALIGLVAPKLLGPANRAWLKLGHFLFTIFSPVMMFAIFAIAFVPTGAVLRLMGKDLLGLKFDARAGTYWTKKDPPAAESMKYQF